MLRSFFLLTLPWFIGSALCDEVSGLFESTTLVYEDDFDGELPERFWEVRQHTTWKIEEGVLKGSSSSKEFQAKKIAAGDKAHAGLKPVIWLKGVPENFVCKMRVRYSAENHHARFPIFDVGHHIHTIHLGKSLTTLHILRDQETLEIKEPLVPLNEWSEVTIEVKKGILRFTVGKKTHTFVSDLIDMTGHSQIDFKGIDYGTCEIDWIKLWEGK